MSKSVMECREASTRIPRVVNGLKRGFAKAKSSILTAFDFTPPAKSPPAILSLWTMTEFSPPSKNCKGGADRGNKTAPGNPDGPHPLPEVRRAL